MTPKFSIAIPVYNRREYLVQAIGSCLNQTAADFELVVSDDCSPDDLQGPATSFRDSRIKYFRSESRLGAARNHQRAVSLCRGSQVVVLNSDDLLLPNCLEIAGNALGEHLTASAVYFSTTYLVGSRIEGFHPVPKLHFADKGALEKNTWLEKFHGTSPTCCLFRKGEFDRLGGYRVSLRLAYDWDLYMRFLSVGGGVLFLPRVLCIYRKHPEQMMQAHSADGLYDMLDLWRLDEYAHWPSWEIADLVLSQVLASVRSGQGLLELLKQIRGRGVFGRLLGGGGEAIYRRLSRRAGFSETEARRHYEPPADLERAIQAANALIAELG